MSTTDARPDGGYALAVLRELVKGSRPDGTVRSSGINDEKINDLVREHILTCPQVHFVSGPNLALNIDCPDDGCNCSGPWMEAGGTCPHGADFDFRFYGGDLWDAIGRSDAAWAAS